MSTSTMAQPELSQTSQIAAREAQYLVQSYSRYPLALQRGRGCYVWDVDGKRYLDLITGIGVNALGHAHPRLVKIIRQQAGAILHTSNLYYHEYQGRLAERLAKVSGLARTFFCNSGTEGMEGAIKMIRAHGNKTAPGTGKFEIISLNNSFHGRTMGALALTGQEKYRTDFEPLIPGVKFVPLNDSGALEQMVSPKTAGIVLEWIQGEGGIFPMTVEYARRARELATRFDALLVFDETQCGVGRTGTYFAYQLTDPPILPDIMVAAKPLACGLPLGIVVANEKAAGAITPGMHGSTFGGGPLACRLALEFFDILDELLPSISVRGAYFRERLDSLRSRFGFIKGVRGEGLMIGLQLDIPGKQLVLDAMQEGLLINCTHETVLRFLPPYMITEKEIDSAISKLTKIFKKSGAAAAA